MALLPGPVLGLDLGWRGVRVAVPVSPQSHFPWRTLCSTGRGHGRGVVLVACGTSIRLLGRAPARAKAAATGTCAGNGTSSSLPSDFSFQEDEIYCHISIPVNPETTAAKVIFKLRRDALTVGVQGCEPFPFISNEALSGSVDREESTWEITSSKGQRTLVVELRKLSRGLWGQPFGQPQPPATGQPQSSSAAAIPPEEAAELFERLLHEPDLLRTSDQQLRERLRPYLADRPEKQYELTNHLSSLAQKGQVEGVLPWLQDLLGRGRLFYAIEVPARFALVDCYTHMSRFLEALEESGKLIEVTRRAHELWSDLWGDGDDGDEDIPRSWLAYSIWQRGSLKFEMGIFDDCIQEYREALAVVPKSLQAKGRTSLALALHEVGRIDEALELYQSAFEAWEGEDGAGGAKNIQARDALDAGACAASVGRHGEAARFFGMLKDPTYLDVLCPESPEAETSLLDADLKGVLFSLVNALCMGDSELAAERENVLKSGAGVIIFDVGGKVTPPHKSTWNLIAGTPLGAAPDKSFFYGTRAIMDLAVRAADLQGGLLLEFGVFHGGSLRWLAGHFADEEVHGFDSLRGLPEAWNEWPVGKYSTQGALPQSLPSNARMHVGLFKDALPLFLDEHPGQPVRFMNVDCDIYSSAKDILDCLADRDCIRPGTIILFDEYIMVRNWQDNEYRAFQEAAAGNGWTFEYLAFSLVTGQAVVRITGVEEQDSGPEERQGK